MNTCHLCGSEFKRASAKGLKRHYFLPHIKEEGDDIPEYFCLLRCMNNECGEYVVNKKESEAIDHALKEMHFEIAHELTLLFCLMFIDPKKTRDWNIALASAASDLHRTATRRFFRHARILNKGTYEEFRYAVDHYD